MYNSYSNRNSYNYKSDRYRSRSKQKRDRSDDQRRRSRSYQERDRTRQRKRQRSRSKDRNRSGLSIIVEPKTKIEIGGATQKSQIKVHFRFDGIKIGPVHEEELMEKLKTYFNQQFGPVVHLSKSIDSKPGFLIMELGFETDYSAEKALNGGIDKLLISIYDKTVQISAKPTSIFQVWLSLHKKKAPRRDSSQSRSSDRKKTRKQKHKKKGRKNSRSRSSSYQSSSRSSSERSRKHRKRSRSNERTTHYQKYQTSRDRDRQHYRHDSYNKTRDNYESKDSRNDYQKEKSYERVTKESTTRAEISPYSKAKEETPVYKTVLFWGLHVTLSAKDVDLYLQKHREGPFVSKRELAWKKLEGSPACQILQGSFQQKMVKKLMMIGGTLQIKDHPFIAIDCELSDKQKIIQKISEFQVNIKLPVVVEPYYLLKSLNECGKVIQIVSNNEFTQSGLSDYFNVTFASKTNCRKFKSIKRTSKGIQIYQVSTEDKFVPVYRPTPTTELVTKKQFQSSKRSEGELESNVHSPKPSPIVQEESDY